MKKLLRVLFIFISIGIFFFGTFVLFEEFYGTNVLDKLKSDLTLLIPLFLAITSLPSLIFNVWKFKKTLNKNSIFYKSIRITDLIFAISILILVGTALFFLIKDGLIFDGYGFQTYFYIIRDIVSMLLFVLSLLQIIDNFKFHKALPKDLEEESIDDIGHSSR